MLTVVAIAAVVVTAANIGTFPGDEVTIGGVGSSAVTYSLDGTNYFTTLEPGSTSTSWYTRLEVNAGDYTGPATITWSLEQKDGSSTWNPTGDTTTTTVALTGSGQIIYASSDGLSTGNHDWSGDVDAAGTYRVVASVETA